MTDLRTYSESRVGSTWSESDHIRLVSQLDKADALAQAVHNYRPTDSGGRVIDCEAATDAEIERIKAIQAANRAAR